MYDHFNDPPEMVMELGRQYRYIEPDRLVKLCESERLMHFSFTAFALIGLSSVFSFFAMGRESGYPIIGVLLPLCSVFFQAKGHWALSPNKNHLFVATEEGLVVNDGFRKTLYTGPELVSSNRSPLQPLYRYHHEKRGKYYFDPRFVEPMEDAPPLP